jgi:hypothetical protein
MATYLRNFSPSPVVANRAGSIIIAPTNANQVFALPEGGGDLELNNTCNVTVYFEQGFAAAGAGAPTASIAPNATAGSTAIQPGSYPIEPNQCKIVSRLGVEQQQTSGQSTTAQFCAVICAANPASGNFKVTAGVGS